MVYMQKDFYDAYNTYYDHGCSIVDEKDVLQTDIVGKTKFVSLKRWWYNLFLLSYSDRRTRALYTSSQSMRMDRIKHFRHYRQIIHPMSKFSNFWDFLILNVVLINKFIFHHNTSVIFGQLAKPFYYLAVVLEFIIIIDLLISIRTGYIDDDLKKVVLVPRKVLLKFLSTDLFIFSVSAIPLEMIMFLRFGQEIDCEACKTNGFVCTLKIVSMFSLLRIYKESEYWNRERGSFKVTYFFKFFRICILGLVTMLQILNFADTINLISILITGQLEHGSYYSYMLKHKFKVKNPPRNIVLFCFEISRVCKSLLLFGYGLLPNKTTMDKMWSLLTYVIANMFYMWSLLECYACLSRTNFPEDQMVLNWERTTDLLRCRQLSDSLSSKVSKYYRFNLTKQTVIEKQNGLFESFPDSLWKEIKIFSYGRYITKIPYFSEWPLVILDDLTLMLKEDVYLIGDVVANNWNQGDGLTILDAGVMAVFSAKDQEVGHMIDGDFFGELSLVTDKEIRMSSVIAVTNSRTLILDKAIFRTYMRAHPKLFFDLKQKLRYKFSTSHTSLDTAGDDIL